MCTCTLSTIYLFSIQGPGTVFNPEKKTEVFHEAKYKVFLQMGNHQREYRYHQFVKLSREYFDIMLITELIKSKLSISEI